MKKYIHIIYGFVLESVVSKVVTSCISVLSSQEMVPTEKQVNPDDPGESADVPLSSSCRAREELG